jgi:hypothetical protein
MERAFQRCIACRGGAKKNFPSWGWWFWRELQTPPFSTSSLTTLRGVGYKKQSNGLLLPTKLRTRRGQDCRKRMRIACAFFTFLHPRWIQLRNPRLTKSPDFFLRFFTSGGLSWVPPIHQLLEIIGVGGKSRREHLICFAPRSTRQPQSQSRKGVRNQNCARHPSELHHP